MTATCQMTIQLLKIANKLYRSFHIEVRGSHTDKNWQTTTMSSCIYSNKLSHCTFSQWGFVVKPAGDMVSLLANRCLVIHPVVREQHYSFAAMFLVIFFDREPYIFHTEKFGGLLYLWTIIWITQSMPLQVLHTYTSHLQKHCGTLWFHKQPDYCFKGLPTVNSWLLLEG